jgi:hypothetical protein
MKKWQVFISYSHADALEVANRVAQFLDCLYWADVLLDIFKLGEAGNLSGYVSRIENSNEFIVICTSHSKQSWWVGFECGLAMKSVGPDHIWPVRGDSSSSFSELVTSLQLGTRICTDDELVEYLKGVATQINGNIREYLQSAFRRVEKGARVRVVEEYPGEITRSSFEIEWGPEHEACVGRELQVISTVPGKQMLLVLEGSSAYWPIEWITPE